MFVLALIAAAFTFVALAWLTFAPFFREPGSFQESVHYTFMPDIVSWYRGEYFEDLMASMRMGIWLSLSALPALLVYLLVNSLGG